jgi:hypothetical protein
VRDERELHNADGQRHAEETRKSEVTRATLLSVSKDPDLSRGAQNECE